MVHVDRIVLDSNGSLDGNWGSDGLKRAVENLIDNAVKYGFSRAPIKVSLKWHRGRRNYGPQRRAGAY